MAKNSRLQLLSKALPVALMMSGHAPQALAFELSAGNTIAAIGDALSRGFLFDAQDTLNRLRICGVNAFMIGDTTITLSQFNLALTGLAQSDDTAWLGIQDIVLSAPGSRVVFLTDGGPATSCEVVETTESFVAGSVV